MIATLDLIAQIAITIFSTLAVLLVARLDKWKKYGYLSGLISEPFWFITAVINMQWGIIILCVVYTIGWGIGTYNYWIKEPRLRKEKENA
jgi:hypothetical protein